MMLEKWKNAVDKVKYFGALLTDLSKAFDCFSHVFHGETTRLWLRLAGTKTYSKLPIKQKTKE